MISYNRGDVVLVHFPYADLVTWGKRPALVVQDERTRTDLGHYVLAQITSRPRSGPTRVPVSMDSPEGRAMRLKQDSVIMVDVLQTTETELIDKCIGHYPAMDKVAACLRQLFGLLS